MRSQETTETQLPANDRGLEFELPLDAQGKQLQLWIENDLEMLERKYADFVTPNSTSKSFGR